MVIDCCIPNPEQQKEIEKMIKSQQGPNDETMKDFMKNNNLLPPPPPSRSITDMLGGPSITSQLAPILSGVSKMISTMPNKNKLEGNIAGGNFSIEIVDEQTRNIAISILQNMVFETRKKKKEEKS